MEKIHKLPELGHVQTLCVSLKPVHTTVYIQMIQLKQAVTSHRQTSSFLQLLTDYLGNEYNTN